MTYLPRAESDADTGRELRPVARMVHFIALTTLRIQMGEPP